MAAGSTPGKATGLNKGEGQTMALTGLTAATDYDVTVTFPNGQMSTSRIHTDGSGAYTMPPVPTNERGTYTMNVMSVAASVYSTTWKGV